MDIISAAALGTSLAADAMAASFARGTKSSGSSKSGAIETAFCFGTFQMFMPLLGWSIGKVGRGMFSGFDHMIAFAILLFLGIKMIADSGRDRTVSSSGGRKELFILAFATSIDALASGIALPVSVGAVNSADMFAAIGIIGTVTFILSLVGYISGSKLRNGRVRYAGCIGGIMLIIIAVRTLLAG